MQVSRWVALEYEFLIVFSLMFLLRRVQICYFFSVFLNITGYGKISQWALYSKIICYWIIGMFVLLLNCFILFECIASNFVSFLKCQFIVHKDDSSISFYIYVIYIYIQWPINFLILGEEGGLPVQASPHRDLLSQFLTPDQSVCTNFIRW